MAPRFYQYLAKSIQGEEICMETYQGKVVLVVNTASKCGFTPQYAALETLYKKYHEHGFEILDFPCNQFGNQEPGNENQIAEGCLIDYGITFPMFSKIEVNGPNAHPIYKYLKNTIKGWFGKGIKWNFTKFLLDAEGTPLKRFSTLTKPEKIEKYIKKIIGLKNQR